MGDASFEFRPLAASDLPALHRWFHAPHARRWFADQRPRSLADVADEYLPAIAGSVPIRAYVAHHEGRAIGMVEWMRSGDFPELQRLYGIEDPDAANCDVLIGEEDAAHRGLGAPLIRALLHQLVFADPRISSCVIDPVPDNAIAIRAYEKVGFRFVRAVPEDGEGNGLYLMELGREELDAVRVADPFFVRPARDGELAVARDIDDDACSAYAELGLTVDLGADHPFVRAEGERWAAALREGRLLFACAPDRTPVGFASLGLVDGEPLLQQVSVRRAWMRRGIGRALVLRAQRWSVRPGTLWLTTYDARVPWNQPWYETLGFTVVADGACGQELRRVLDEERHALPVPEHRVAMVYRHPREA